MLSGQKLQLSELSLRKETNAADDLLITLLSYDKVSSFVLLAKARNSSLFTGKYATDARGLGASYVAPSPWGEL